MTDLAPNNQYKNILKAWIMVEHLSEGNIKSSECDNYKVANYGEDESNMPNYYEDMLSIINKKRQNKFKQSDDSGLIIYGKTFKFQKVIDILRDAYKLEKPVVEPYFGDKFSCAIGFKFNNSASAKPATSVTATELNETVEIPESKANAAGAAEDNAALEKSEASSNLALSLNPDSIFFTVSGYILDKAEVILKRANENNNNGTLIVQSQFTEYEEAGKEEIKKMFLEIEGDEEPVQAFNKAMDKLIRTYILNDETEADSNKEKGNIKIKYVNNLNTEMNNLHSFFVDDLGIVMKDKGIAKTNVEAYLSDNPDIKNRKNLDSKNDSKDFNEAALKEILEPLKYPSGRFPSKTAYALSFMQQAAVNIAISANATDKQMRSVNGPPGTGKTTLLKDVFAELIVQQAEFIANMNPKMLVYKSNNFEKSKKPKRTLAALPLGITEKGIVVASSNNGAVQNIVKELPLKKDIDEGLIDNLVTIDYFKEIANADVKTYCKKDDAGKYRQEIKLEPHEVESDKELWGLFSLEGGAAHNMANVTNKISAICKEFESGKYQGKPEIYSDFIKQYVKVQGLKEEAQALFVKQEKLLKMGEAEKLVKEFKASEIALKTVLNNFESFYKTKPSFFNFKRKKEFNKQLNFFRDQISEKERKQAELERELSKNFTSSEIADFDNDFKAIKQCLAENEKKLLKFSLPYNELQLSNPWFDEKFRKEQSKLLILALAVRKQFLLENLKNLNEAIQIWKNQASYDDSWVIDAWGWINLAIPVISSTFASFGRMFRRFGANTLGYLFVDEAGQALPQASVGAIYRSKHVMVVGDPAQIKPVLTLDAAVLRLLRESFQVDIKYLSESASTQTLVDACSEYGFYKFGAENLESWIGIPLWVHRRCKDPMFSISNKISYNNLMVQGNTRDGKGAAEWFDVRGKADDKYVEEQKKFLVEKIEEIQRKRSQDLEDGKDLIYVISPFTNVAKKLADALKEIGFTKYANSSKNGKATNVGTIHTFQGKEAPIVFLVLGADESSKGAASWAVAEPNMMNVAATRAKEEFYIIGDKDLYGQAGVVAKDTIDVIDEYNKRQEAAKE